jgi:hypothetical protein
MYVYIVAFAIFFVQVQFLWFVRDLHSLVSMLVHVTTFTGYPHLILLCKGKFKRGHWGCSKVTGNLT